MQRAFSLLERMEERDHATKKIQHSWSSFHASTARLSHARETCRRTSGAAAATDADALVVLAEDPSLNQAQRARILKLQRLAKRLEEWAARMIARAWRRYLARTKEQEAATRLQAVLRGSTARKTHGDDLLAALVLKAARAEVVAALSRQPNLLDDEVYRRNSAALASELSATGCTASAGTEPGDITSPASAEGTTTGSGAVRLAQPLGGGDLSKFISAGRFDGAIVGYVYKMDMQGLGYYLDGVPVEPRPRPPRLGRLSVRRSSARSASSLTKSGTVRSTDYFNAAQETSGALQRRASSFGSGWAKLRAATGVTALTLSSSADNSMVDANGQPANKMYKRLARKEHWRCCPHCENAVEQRGSDGLGHCSRCGTEFRWVDAKLVAPVGSLGQLLTEFRWEGEDKSLEAPVTAKGVVSKYLGGGTMPPCTPATKAKLQLWRAAMVVPVLASMPLLIRKERSARREAWLQQTSTAAFLPSSI